MPSAYEEAFGFKRKFIKPDNSYGELNTGNAEHCAVWVFVALPPGIDAELKNGNIIVTTKAACGTKCLAKIHRRIS